MQQNIRVITGALAMGALLLGVSAEARQSREFRAEQIDRQTQQIPLGASGQLELRNLVGDISVTAGSGRDVTIEIVRRSRGRTDADARLGLERVQAVVEHKGDRATVQAQYPEQRRAPYSVSVSYVVTAPAGTRVSATSVSGDVTVRNITGDVRASVTSGDITVTGAGAISSVRAISGDVTLQDCRTEAGITVGTISGDVLLERIAAQRLNVDVTDGDIIAREVRAASAQLKTLSGDVEFGGTLSAGGRYEIQSHAGDVRLTVPGGAGFELQVNTFSGSITVAPGALDLRNVSTSRRSLRGTVGDGAATVTVTTFSGDVLIGRR